MPVLYKGSAVPKGSTGVRWEQCLNETSDPPLSSLCLDGHEVGE